MAFTSEVGTLNSQAGTFEPGQFAAANTVSLTGAVVGASSATGDVLGVTVPLSGAVAGISAATDQGVYLDGASNGAGAITHGFQVDLELGPGAITGTSASATSNPTIYAVLSPAASAGTSSVQEHEIFLQNASAGTSVVDGSIATGIRLGPVASDGASVIDGTLLPTVPLTGAVTGTSATDSTMTGVVVVFGTSASASVSTVDGTITAPFVALSGAVASASATSAQLNKGMVDFTAVPKPKKPRADGTSKVVNAFGILWHLTGASASTSVAAGALDLNNKPLAGDVIATSVAAATLDTTYKLATGETDGTSAVAGILITFPSTMAGSADATSAVAGTLTTDPIPVALSGAVMSTSTADGAVQLSPIALAGAIDSSGALDGAPVILTVLAGDVMGSGVADAWLARLRYRTDSRLAALASLVDTSRAA